MVLGREKGLYFLVGIRYLDGTVIKTHSTQGSLWWAVGVCINARRQKSQIKVAIATAASLRTYRLHSIIANVFL
jgi:hypothetical protein